MSAKDSSLVPVSGELPAGPATLREFARARDTALAAFERGLAGIQEAEAAIGNAIGEHLKYYTPVTFRDFDDGRASISAGTPEEQENQRTIVLRGFRRHLDRSFWQAVGKAVRLDEFMDSQQLREWHQQLQDDPPEFTLETATATLARLQAEQPKIFRRGLVNVFSGLSWEYRSNSRFAIGPRIIVKYAIHYLGGWNHTTVRKLIDLERACWILMRGRPPEVSEQVVEENTRRDTKEFSTPFFRVVVYGTARTAHIHFEKEAQDALNKELAEHFGPILGDAEALRKTGRRRRKS